MTLDEVFSVGVRFALIASRSSGFVVVSPFPSTYAPTQTRLALVLLLSWVVTAAMPTGLPVPEFGLGLIGPTFTELATGLALGFVFRLGLAASDLLGASIAQAMGLSFASVFDPTLAESRDPLSKIVSLAAMLLMLGSGAYRTVLAYVLESFRLLPPGAAPSPAVAMPLILAWMTRSVDAGIRLALPVIAITLALQITLALIARAAPSLQVFNVGIALTIASGFAILGMGWEPLLDGLHAHFTDVNQVLDGLITQLATAPP